MRIPKSVLIGFGIGVVIGVPFFLLSFFTAFGICSDTSIAERLFPFALIVEPSLLQRPLLAFILAAIQYPLYGALLGIGWTHAGKRTYIYIATILIVLITHVVGVSYSTQRVESMWKQRFSQTNR
jgi:hypothetical protein